MKKNTVTALMELQNLLSDGKSKRTPAKIKGNIVEYYEIRTIGSKSSDVRGILIEISTLMADTSKDFVMKDDGVKEFVPECMRKMIFQNDDGFVRSLWRSEKGSPSIMDFSERKFPGPERRKMDQEADAWLPLVVAQIG